LGAKVVPSTAGTGINSGTEEGSWQAAARENNVLANPINIEVRRNNRLLKAFVSQVFR
jgi:hypothetical protein